MPLITPPDENVDDIQTDQLAATIVDAVPIMVEGKLNLVKRPGLIKRLDLGTNNGIDGLYWFDKKRVAIAVSAGRVWKITDTSFTKTELTGSTDLLASAPVKFANDATRVAMANGGKIVYSDLSTLTTIADPDAPVRVTHLAAIDSYLLAADVETQTVQYSNVNDLTTWDAIDFFSAESKPDDVVAIDQGFGEIIALGRESVEFWVNDGQTPFSRIPGSAQPFGTAAPYSLALVGSTWMWLDHTRRFVTMQGRQVVPVSTPYDRVLQRYASVDDAVGYATLIDGMPIYVLNFPTSRETLCYNWETQQWHKWGYWVPDQGIYQRFRGLSYCYARAWNKHLIGDHSNGIIYEASRQVFTDDNAVIRSLLRTGHNTYGSNFTKQSHIVRLKCKRGLANAFTDDPTISMRRRINNKPQWGNERFKSLGQVGQHEQFIDWRANGIYRSCQYEFVHSDNSDLVLMGGQENLTVLGR